MYGAAELIRNEVKSILKYYAIYVGRSGNRCSHAEHRKYMVAD